MRIFVAAWFFPPSTSSEGNVTYKLLRNSRHNYVVCSSSSELWSYKKHFEISADNIEVLPVDTDEFDVWIEEGLRLFEEQHAKQPFDAFMTRSMPSESITFAQLLKERFPNIPWIASIADPIAKSPYDIRAWIDENEDLAEKDKDNFREALVLGCKGWHNHPYGNIRTMVSLKDTEDYAINNADLLVFPHDILRSYVLGPRKRNNAITIPHSYDSTFYEPVASRPKNNVFTLSYLGHSDAVRSLDPLIEALKLLKTTNEHVLEKLRFRFIGNVYEHSRIQIYNYYLYDVVSIEPSVDYYESLKIMQQSDWLIHMDVEFEHLESTGSSVYFAAKLADYMGTDAPIFALTGRGSPADTIVREAGGISLRSEDAVGIAQTLTDLAEGKLPISINQTYRDRYGARTVSQYFDDEVERRLMPSCAAQVFTRTSWPEIQTPAVFDEKFLTVCIPAYKVESYLDRCLYSFIMCDQIQRLELIVVNDGSPDSSREIALAYQERYPSIVKLIDKENGGHGSTINTALKVATGAYFRVVDGDDWIDGQNLTKTIDTILNQKIDADLISSNYHQVYCFDGETVPWYKMSDREYYKTYDFLHENFSMEYFTIHSSMVKTKLLQEANFELQEHTFYVDVEYTLFPIPLVQTVAFTPEYVYRYAIGNADQSVNYEVFLARYDHHDRVMRRMLNFFKEKRETLAPGQLNYIQSLLVNHLIRTHYELNLVWDPDYERASERARNFDAFFKTNTPDLYKRFRKKYKKIRKAQRHGFSPQTLKHISTLETHSMRSILRKALKRIRRSKVGKVLARNRYARTLFHRLRGN
jgi:glycosyltransferase involved in cell wall biosynthesis